MVLERIKKQCCNVVIASTIAWYVLLAVAMVAYPGGYDFFGQPVSALGYVMVYGQPNTVSFTFFSLAFSVLIPGLALLLILVPMTLSGNSTGRRLSLAGNVPGIVAIVFFGGMLLAPLDTAPEMHMLAANVAFTCFGFMGMFYSAATWKATEYHKLVPALWLLFFTIDLTYALVSLTTDYSILIFRVMSCTMQKAVDYLLVSTMLYMVWQAKQRFTLAAPKAQ